MNSTPQAISNINSAALAFLAVMCVGLFVGNRRTAMASVLTTASFIPLGQQLVVFGLHLFFLRILILVGLCRVILRGELGFVSWNRLDSVFSFWVILCLACGFLRGPTAETFGVAYDALGAYFMMRALINQDEDAVTNLKWLCYISVAIASFMLFEKITHKNPFHFLGGVPEFASERAERFRAQGPFRHSILAGTFGASLLPMLAGLMAQKRNKLLAVVGVGACIVIVFASASSGPLLSLAGAVLALALWPMRDRMLVVRFCICIAFFGLSVLMNAPVWYLIGRLSELVGGTGWYRSYLIEQAVHHLGEWWLIGSSRTVHWMPWESNVLSFDQNNIDITNHYIVQGLRGGIIGLVCFISLIVICFAAVGRYRRELSGTFLHEGMVWSFGAALTAHCLAFISVSYFDQISVFWYWLLAVMALLVQGVKHGSATDATSPGNLAWAAPGPGVDRGAFSLSGTPT